MIPQVLQRLLWKGGNCLMNKNLIKGLGILATVVGFAATFVSDWVAEQKLDEKINEKVNEALAEREKESES